MITHGDMIMLKLELLAVEKADFGLTKNKPSMMRHVTPA
jgi:hypothetical protein